MSEKMQETIADIVAEMRRYSDFVIVGNNYCNRIEAAHRRDVDRLNSCIQATVSRSDAEIDRLRLEITELKKKVGNAAKMYEALCEIAKRIENICGSDECDDREISKIGALIKQTLAAPPRNCDKVKTSWEVLKEWHEGLDTANDIVRLLDWLLATATEKEGGNDGK